MMQDPELHPMTLQSGEPVQVLLQPTLVHSRLKYGKRISEILAP